MGVNRIAKLVFLAVAVSGLHASPVQAGDPFPPFGAWAYGSGFTTPVHRHHLGHRHTRIAHYRAPRYWPAPRFHYGYHYRPHFRYSYSNYSSFSLGYPSYTAFYSSCGYRPIVSVPVVQLPAFQFHAVPVHPMFYTAPPCAWPISQSAVITYPLVQQSPAQPLSTLLTTARTDPSSVPDAILEAADSIFRAGGYREAATAYAQISSRYGTSDAILARRFAAQIAAGDLKQAVVISALAEAAGFQIQRASLPDQSLDGLGMDQAFVASKSEALAAEAYAHPNDYDTLAALGHWMQLTGDNERSQLFIAHARQLAEGVPGNMVTRSSKTEFVSLD